jgi:CMP-2-keto-3-deoxyoctulosonic acid synthetase
MKYLITIFFAAFFCLSAVSKNLPNKMVATIKINYTAVKKVNDNTKISLSKVYCGMNEELAAMNQAFAMESMGMEWCMTVQTTGAGLTDCFSYFTNLRRAMVESIINNYQDCPEFII